MSDEPDTSPWPEGAPVGSIQDIDIQTEMEQSFLDYAMSVITARALPDVRDGLKPVHRRILWGMYDQGTRPNRPYVKCARVVGEVMGKYHPHGDQAIYDALVRLGQSFSLRHPLIDPHGNFGSPNDPPAAMRYTECRLHELAMRLLDGIDEQTVDFADNFDSSEQEPKVLPSRFPNLLVNGSQGIAVGMATNIPPHNLGEVIDAVNHLLENPEATNESLMEFVKGPDFPTRGRIMGYQGIRDAYATGQGTIKLRASAEIEESGSSTRIVVTEIPYQTSAEVIEEKVADLVNRRVIDGIRQIHNESAKGQTKLVFELKRGRSRAGGAQQPVQILSAANQLPCEHGGAGRRGAPDHDAARLPDGLCGPPARGGPASHPAPLGRSSPPRAHPGRPGAGGGHDRRDHRRHSGVKESSCRPGRVGGRAVRVQ